MILAAAQRTGGNSGALLNEIFMIALIVLLIIFMWVSSRKQRKNQEKKEDWRRSLKPGDKVATVSGLIGTIKEADPDHDQVVIESEGSLSRWRIQAIVEPPVIPHYADDDEPAEEKKDDDFPVETKDSVKEDSTGKESAESSSDTPAEDDSSTKD